MSSVLSIKPFSLISIMEAFVEQNNLNIVCSWILRMCAKIRSICRQEGEEISINKLKQTGQAK